jgi:hypothetical protein
MTEVNNENGTPAPQPGNGTPPTPPAQPSEAEKALASALAQKEHFREKFEAEEKAKKELEAKLNEQNGNSKPSLDVEDYIDISASLEGLDQREKEKLARDHKLTGKPIKELRNDEDFVLWQTAYKAKLAKELSLKPSTQQGEVEKPKTLTERLRGASLADKEKILAEAGLVKQPRPRSDRTPIGGQR